METAGPPASAPSPLLPPAGRGRSGMSAGRLVTFGCLLAVFALGHLYDILTFKEHWPYSPYRMYSAIQGKTFTAYYVYGITGLDPYEETSLSPYGVPRKLFGNIYLRGEEKQGKAASGKMTQAEADAALADAKTDVARRLKEFLDGQAAPDPAKNPAKNLAKKPAKRRARAAAAAAATQAVTRPATTRSATPQSATTRLAATRPATTRPATTRPATTRLAATRPAADPAPPRAGGGKFLGARLYKTTWELRPDASNRYRPDRVVLVQVMADAAPPGKAPSTQTVPAVSESPSGEGEDRPGIDTTGGDADAPGDPAMEPQ